MTNTDTNTNTVGTAAYVVAGLGFIPGIGLLFSSIAIVIGVLKRKHGGQRLIIIGMLGIAVTVLLYGGLYYKGFVERGGVFDELRAKMAKMNVTGLVRSVEYYKITHGEYPPTLTALKDSLGKENLTPIYDPTDVGVANSGSSRLFFFQLTDDKTHYYLLGLGADQKPFTGDDILPDLPDQERVKTGLLIKRELTQSGGVGSSRPQ